LDIGIMHNNKMLCSL